MRTSTLRLEGATAASCVETSWPNRTVQTVTLVLIAGVTVLPVLLAEVGAGGLARVVFPAAAAALGAVLVRSRPVAFIGFTCWLFLVVPLLRRLVDLQAGFVDVNTMLVAPYAVLILAAPKAFVYVVDGRPHAGKLALVLLSLVWGLSVDLSAGRVITGSFEALRWLVPVIAFAYVLAHADRLEAIASALRGLFLWALPAMGAYGALQYVAVPAWDAYWMANAPITSIGQPLPFEVRVFGTMNSPGSFTAALGTGIFLLALRPGALPVLSSLLAVPVFALSMQRSGQAAFVLIAGLAMVLGAGSIPRRLAPIVIAGAVGTAAVFAVPDLRYAVLDRLDSTLALGQDVSAQARLRQHLRFPEMLAETPFGRGLAWRSTFAHVDGGSWVEFDSGILETFLALGVMAGGVYLLVLVVLAAGAARALRDRFRPIGQVGALIALFGLVQLPLGLQNRGEHGFFLWLGLGLALAAVLQPAERASDCRIVGQRS